LVDDHITAHFLPVVVDENVPHDRHRPGFKVGSGIVFVSICDDSQSRVLVQILCVHIIARELQRKSPQSVTNAIELAYIIIGDFMVVKSFFKLDCSCL